ncbi:MAG TPA: hypothetical protein VF519_15520 [Mycobacteriales bacterium]|jgi:hypothetical protein
MTVVLADAAPTGAGLAIVGVILLAFVAIVIAAVFFSVRFLLRRGRRGQS